MKGDTNMAGGVTNSQSESTVKDHLVSLPSVLRGKVLPLIALEGEFKPEVNPSPICEELCGRKAYTCICNPNQCPKAFE